jgi:hypothetical protein
LYLPELPKKVTKKAYLAKIMLLFKTLTIVADQVIDIMLVATLFFIKEYWFAIVYLAVDVFPAAIIMWQKFQTEKSWKVLVCFISNYHNMRYQSDSLPLKASIAQFSYCQNIKYLSNRLIFCCTSACRQTLLKQLQGVSQKARRSSVSVPLQA